MQLLQCCPVCRESCGENDLRKNIILQQLTDHVELLPARICTHSEKCTLKCLGNSQYSRALTSANVLTGARLAHPSGDKSAAENLRRKDPTFKSSSAIAKHISGNKP
jgi:hypothetical protein